LAAGRAHYARQSQRLKEHEQLAVKIRLKRIGAKKRPFYRIVVANSTASRDGRFIENVGHYDPLKEPPVVHVDEEKVLRWLGHGAQPTDTTRALLKKQGVWGRFEEAKAAARQAK
jgi:small subunit ribosomal protein S16